MMGKGKQSGRMAVALTAILCACSGQVATYTAGQGGAPPDDAGAGGASVPDGAADSGPDDDPDADPPGCVGHAQCWPLEYCNLVHGLCASQDAAMCLVGQDLQDCGTGVCCVLAVGEHECRPLSDCEPEGEAIP